MRGHPVGWLAALLLSGCTVEEWRNADLQLDVRGAALDSEDVIRICVEGVGSRDAALGAGRVAYPGVPPNTAVTVTVDALTPAADTGGDAVRLGRAGPVVFETVSFMEADWQACEGDCSPCRQATEVSETTDSRLFAVRFLGLD